MTQMKPGDAEYPAKRKKTPRELFLEDLALQMKAVSHHRHVALGGMALEAG